MDPEVKSEKRLLILYLTRYCHKIIFNIQ